MTVSLLTKPQKVATIAPSSALLVLQPPGHLFAASHLLTPGEYRLGSSSECELVLEADGVSPEHALLTVNPQGVRLQALEGNTWVNDFLVTQATLRRGDRLSFGPLTFTLRAATADDLLAHLPAQDTQPVEPLRSAQPTAPAVIETIDEAIAQVEAARSSSEPLSPIVESETPTTTAQSLEPTCVTAAIIGDDVIPSMTNFSDVVIDEEEHAPVELTSPALAAEIAAWQAERAAEEEQSRTRQTELDGLAAGLEERELRLAAEITAWHAERASEDERSRTRQTELATLATELEERELRLEAEITAWHAERAPEDERTQTRQAELAVLAAGLEERESRLSSWEARLIRREDFLDQRQTEFDSQRTELNHRESALTEERIRLEQVATTARTELAAEAEKQAAAWADWETTQRRLSAELNNEFAALAEVEAACTTNKARLTEDQQAWAATRTTWQTEQAEWEARRHEQQHQLAEWEAEAQQLRADLVQERTQLGEQRAELQAEACQRSAAHRELFESRQDTQRERRLLAEQQSAWITEREAEWLELRERRRRMDADEREIAELRQHTQASWNEVEAALTAAKAAAVSTAAVPETAEPAVAQPVPSIEPASEVALAWENTSIEEPAVAIDSPVDDTPSVQVSATLSTPADVDLPVEEIADHNWMEPRIENPPVAEEFIGMGWNSNFDSSPAAANFAEVDRSEDYQPASFDEPAPNRFDNQWPIEASTVTDSSWPVHQEIISEPSFEDRAVPAESVFTDRLQPNGGETEPQESLHSQLAEMFGLPQDFGHPSSVDNDQTDAQAEFTSPESPVLEESTTFEEPVPATDSPAQEMGNDSASENEDDAWRSQLAQMLSAQVTAPPPEPAVLAPEVTPSIQKLASPPPIPTPARPAPSEEEDSITAYMERLLARNNMTSYTSDVSDSTTASKTEVSASAPLHSVETMATNLTTTLDAIPAEVTVPTPLPEPRQRVDKDEVRASLQSFREVANLSARSAIATHGSKTLRGEVTVQGVLAGLAGGAAGAYLLAPLWGGTIQPWPGLGCLIASGWMSWQISQSLHRLKTWNPGDRLEVGSDDVETEEIAATDSEIVPESVEMNDVEMNAETVTTVSDDPQEIG